MPELPEVETIVRDLNSLISGKTIEGIRVFDVLPLRSMSKASFIMALRHQVISGVTRRGKAIVIALSSGMFWVIQLKMTGLMIVHQTPAPLPVKETRLVFDLSGDVKLFYNDQRRFGRYWVGRNLEDFKHFQELGPEPLSAAFTAGLLKIKLKGVQRAVKPLLLDHSFIAGIGNIYACEILFKAGISPKRRSGSIKADEAIRLYHEIVAVLNEAIVYRGSSIRNYRDSKGVKGGFNTQIAVYGKTGDPCPRCSVPIVRIVQSGRSTFYCMKCQR